MIKKIKMLFTVLFSALALFVVTAEPCYAGDQIKTIQESEASGIITPIINEFKKSAIEVSDELTNRATKLLWGLALITLFFIGFKQIFSGADFNTLFAEMIKFILGIGFFLFILDPKYMGVGRLVKFVEDFVGIIPMTSHGYFADLNSTSATDFVGTIFKAGWNVFCATASQGKSITEFELVTPGYSITQWLKYLCGLLIALGTFIVFIFISSNYILTLVKGYITICCGVIAVGFGGLTWTNAWAVNYLKQLVKIGLELMAFVFVVKLMLNIQTGLFNKCFNNNTYLDFGVICLCCVSSILTLILAHSIPSAVTSMIEGGTKSFDMSAISQAKVAKDTAKLGMGGAGLAIKGAKGASKLYARLRGKNKNGSVDMKPNSPESKE